MTHQRKLIRDKIAELLSGETDAEDRVYPSRVLPIGSDKLPCINVYANSETVEIYQESPREYKRILSISVEIQAKASESLDDVLDALAKQVETVLEQDHTLGELCADTILKGSELTIDGDGKTFIGSCVLTYETPYYTEAVKDDSSLDDLEQVNVDIKRPDTPEGNPPDAQDEIDLTEE